MKKTYNLTFYISLLILFISWILFFYSIIQAIVSKNFWSITPIISHNVPHGIAGWSLVLGFIFIPIVLITYFAKKQNTKRAARF